MRNFARAPYLARYFILFSLLALLISGCKPLVLHEQSAQNDLINLNSGESLGQTFVSRYNGLEGVALYLKPGLSAMGTLHMTLQPNADDRSGILTRADISLNDLKEGYYRIPFTTQGDSTNQYYYLRLTIDGPGNLYLGIAPANTYLNGALYKNDVPLDAQLAFRLIHDPTQIALGFANEAIIWLGILLACVFLFVVPGWALLSIFLPGWTALHRAEKLGLSAGLSLAIYPIFFLWTDLIGIHLGAFYAGLPPLIGLAAIFWRTRPLITRKSKLKSLEKINEDNPPKSLTRRIIKKIDLVDITLLFTVALVIFTRFWVIRNLDIPMWGDSYQHTIIVQLLVDHRGLFDSWEPYTDLLTFTYHFGFHTAVAIFHWGTGLGLPKATLWTGQIINVLAVLALYPLAIRIGRNRWAGVSTILIAGLLSPMPMYYVNWGRYTQLAGQVILATAVYLIWGIGEDQSSRWGPILLTSLTLGGLALTHYRVLIFSILFIIALFLFLGNRDHWLIRIKNLFIVGIGASIIFLPWFIHVFSGSLLNVFEQKIIPASGHNVINAPTPDTVGNIFVYLPALIWLFLPVIIGWSLWQRENGGTIVSLWWFFILLASHPQWLGLPGASVIGSFTAFIAAYIPASLLIGAAIGWMAERFSNQSPSLNILLLILAIGTGLWGVKQRLNDPDVAQFSLVTSPDLRANAWIRMNTSSNAMFLVNSFLAFDETTVVGSDGGWWLPLLSGRRTILPPINYLIERVPSTNYRDSLLTLTKTI